MKRRLVVLSEIIAPYRIPVFNALAGEASIDLHVIFLARTDPALRQWRIYQDEIRFSYEVLPSWRRRVGEISVLLNWGLTQALQRARPDTVLCGGYNHPAFWKAAWWARRNKVPLMVWVESTARDRRGQRSWVESLKTRFLRRCDAFVVAGQSSSEYLKTYRISGDAIFSAPNAVDTEFFAWQSEEARANAARYRQELGLPLRYFLFAGRLIAQKGVFELLAAYASLDPQARQGIALVFAGDGPQREKLTQQATRIQPGCIQFAGFLQREKLAVYYTLAEALVFPTLSDPWGLVVNEAMACGLPVILSDAAGCASDLVQHGWNGCLVPAGDVQRLAAAMDGLVRSTSLIDQMREHSRLRVRDYSPGHCAAGIARAALSLAGGPCP